MPIQDVSGEELEEMGFKKFRITQDGSIHPDDVEAFLEYDRRPLTEEEKQYIQKCREIYDRWKIQNSASTVQSSPGSAIE